MLIVSSDEHTFLVSVFLADPFQCKWCALLKYHFTPFTPPPPPQTWTKMSPPVAGLDHPPMPTVLVHSPLNGNLMLLWVQVHRLLLQLLSIMLSHCTLSSNLLPLGVFGVHHLWVLYIMFCLHTLSNLNNSNFI